MEEAIVDTSPFIQNQILATKFYAPVTVTFTFRLHWFEAFVCTDMKIIDTFYMLRA